MESKEEILEQAAKKRLELEKMSVHILRAIGRECGVRTPTTKRKTEIINEIIAITFMGQQPYYSPYGRKKNFDLSAVAKEEEKEKSSEEKKILSEDELNKAVREAAAKLVARLPREVVLLMKQRLKSEINAVVDKIIDNYLIQGL